MRRPSLTWLGLAALLWRALGCSDAETTSTTSTASASGATSSGTGGCAPGLLDCGGYCADECPAGCSSDFGDCNGDPADGCEVNLASDANNCGDCGEVCPSPANSVASCSISKCETACELHFMDCDEDPADGCEVFTQDDAQNCGGCGVVCPQGLVCVGGDCTSAPLAASLRTPQYLIVVGGTVYWTNAGTAPDYVDGTIMKIGVDGSAQTTLVTGIAGASILTADATDLYFTSRGTPPSYLDGAIIKLPLGGGAPVKVADAVAAGGVAVDATTLYWTSAGATPNDGAVLSMPIGGGSVTTLAANQAIPYEIAVDASNIYWANAGDGGLWKKPLAGGAATILTTADQPQGFTIDATSLYWADYGTGSIQRVPLMGGPPEVLSSGRSFPLAVAVDGSDVYFSVLNPIPGALRTVPVTGGVTTTLAAPQGEVIAIALDATNVYWLEFGQGDAADGVLRKLGK